MIKKLRLRFILIAMISISIVLFTLIAGINISNYIGVKQSADERISLIIENGSLFGLSPSASDNRSSGSPSGDIRYGYGSYKTITEETPYLTRFFYVSVNDNGTVMGSNLDRIVSMTKDSAVNITLSLLKHHRYEGIYNNYRYRAEISKNQDGSKNYEYFFVNCEQELRTFHTFLYASIRYSLIGLILVFILVVFFSNLMLRPVKESYAKQKRFITDASHEIKTPLTIIDANTEIIEMEHGEDEWTTSTRNQIARLTELTNKLVFLSRMDEEAYPLTKLDFSISDAVWETAEPFLAVAQANCKELSLNIAPGLSYCGDESQIRQLVSLLLDNAIKYSLDNSRIELTLYAAGRNKILTVYNRTEPMQTGSQSVLFERFYRNDASRNSGTGGHGIGLSVAQAIVQSHKGKITAKSEDGNSIDFTVLL